MVLETIMLIAGWPKCINAGLDAWNEKIEQGVTGLRAVTKMVAKKPTQAQV